MKKTLITSLLLLLTAASYASYGTARPQAYHWVVETASQGEPCTVFRIYAGETQLVYEEKIAGKKLDIRKKSVRRQLNKGLDLYVRSVEQLARINRHNMLSRFSFR